MPLTNLRHGIFLPPFHPNEENPTQCLERDLELMVWLDKLGFHEAWIGEHHSAGFEIISSPEIFIAFSDRPERAFYLRRDRNERGDLFLKNGAAPRDLRRNVVDARIAHREVVFAGSRRGGDK
jgi:hypothetical protein